ncbi:MAG: hypothetical protein ACYDDF_01640 [Thermoplasmatota archaeon]
MRTISVVLGLLLVTLGSGMLPSALAAKTYNNSHSNTANVVWLDLGQPVGNVTVCDSAAGTGSNPACGALVSGSQTAIGTGAQQAHSAGLCVRGWDPDNKRCEIGAPGATPVVFFGCDNTQTANGSVQMCSIGEDDGLQLP